MPFATLTLHLLIVIRHWPVIGTVAVVAVVSSACGESTSHTNASAGATSVAAIAGSAGDEGNGASSAGATSGGSAAQEAGGSAGRGGNDAGHSGAAGVAGTETVTAGGSSGSSTGGSATGVSGNSNAAGAQASAGASSGDGSGWIVPSTPGDGWNGPQDPACPSTAVARNAACSSPLGTRCSYAESGDYTLRCQCYTSSTGEASWWCQDHSSIGWDLCPVAYPGDGTCTQLGDVTCYYVDPAGSLEACNCSANVVHCSKWGL